MIGIIIIIIYMHTSLKGHSKRNEAKLSCEMNKAAITVC